MLRPCLPTAELLAVPPNERTDEQVNQLLALRSLDGFANLPPSELLELARCWTYETHEAGCVICAINDENPCFMVVISGSLMLEETKLCHNLGETRPSSVASSEASSSGRSTGQLSGHQVGPGSAVGHHCLVTQSRYFDYGAIAGAPSGCAVLRVNKMDYARIVRRREEKQMADVVKQLKSSPFFSGWSVPSLQRLVYMMERRRLQPGEDVVTQGDMADFCFIIASGACDIVVTIPPSPETGVLEAKERFITRLPAGALVGEAGLLSETGRRNATVRAAGTPGLDKPVEVLQLSKQSFLDLDDETLRSIRETTAYNTACTKEPHLRTEEELDLLQRRTAHLEYIKELPPLVHRELCRVMKYKKLGANTPLFEKGDVAACMYVIISGAAHVFAAGQGGGGSGGGGGGRSSLADVGAAAMHSARQRRHSLPSSPKLLSPAPGGDGDAGGGGGGGGSKWGMLKTKRRHSMSLTALTAHEKLREATGERSERGRPTATLRAGEAAGEAEVLFGEAKHANSAVAIEALQVMAVERDDFSRTLKPHRADVLGGLFSFLQGLPPLAGLSAFELHALAKLARPCTVTEGQLCLASMPTEWPHTKRHDEPGAHASPSAGFGLGALPYDREQVYIIRSGEARLLTFLAEPAATAQHCDEHDDSVGTVGAPLRARGGTRALEVALGRTAPLATLGPSEVISADLLSGDTLTEPEAPWCLQPRGVQLELLVFPRREWDAAIRNSAKTTLRDLAAQRAYFFQTRLHDARREEASRLRVSSRNPLQHALGSKGDPGGRVGKGGSKSSRALLWHETDVEGGGGGAGGEAMAVAGMPRSMTLPQLGRHGNKDGKPPHPPRPGTPMQLGLYQADVTDVTTRTEQLRAQLDAERAWQLLLQLHQPPLLEALGANASMATALAKPQLPAIRPIGVGIIDETPPQAEAIDLELQDDEDEAADGAAQQEQSGQQTDQQSEAKVRLGLGPRGPDGAQQARSRRRQHSREMHEKFKHVISPSYNRRNGEISTYMQRSGGSSGGDSRGDSSSGSDRGGINQAACIGAADLAKAKTKVDATLFGSCASTPQRHWSGSGGKSGPVVLQPRTRKADERRNRA
tara:strand:+ start:121 stop:3405 length:3285 start_codon:yes stop_codon:yes gene_type:complete